MIPLIKVGTRSSALALAQTHEVCAALKRFHTLPDEAIQIIPMSTMGDRILNRPLKKIGGKGLFTEEIESALRKRHIDLAVHSAKDMPAILPEGLHLSIFLTREDPRDAFIGKTAPHIADLPRGAVIGSSSTRRQAMIHRIRPDIKILLFRGNIQTRLQRLKKDGIDGTFLALAGLKRLGIAKIATEIMDPKHFLPAPGQGALLVESRSNDLKINHLLAPLSNLKTCFEILCERAFMAALEGSCRTPLGALARIKNGKIFFSGIILTPDGSVSHTITQNGDMQDAVKIGTLAAEKLKKTAGTDFFTQWYL